MPLLTGSGLLQAIIHHVADTIQADTVIAGVYDDLVQALDHPYPKAVAKEPALAATGPAPTDLLGQAPAYVAAPESGYVQAIGIHALLRLAREHDLVIEIVRRPGHFVIEGRPSMRIWPRARVGAEVVEQAAHEVVIGPKRTPTQDVEFLIGALVEIAVRALSPGINDPRTALTCIDRLAAALAHLARSGTRSPLIHDADGGLRLITDPTTFEGAIDASFNQIRQAANGDVAILLRLAGALTELAEIADAQEHLGAIARHGEMVRRACQRGIVDPADQADAERALQALEAALAAKSDEGSRPPPA